MKRGIAVAIVGLVSLAGGCASPAHYVDKQPDQGIVAIPANNNNWPTYNRREALALIQQHVGPNYQILEEREVVTGQTTRNEQQTNTEQIQNKKNPKLMGERQTTTGTVSTHDTTEWRITYRRVAAPPGAPMGGMPGPGGVMQTGGTMPGPVTGLPPSTVPSVLPGGMQPAGGMQSQFGGGRP